VSLGGVRGETVGQLARAAEADVMAAVHLVGVREYHVPAVVATGNTTELLRDGQIVTVDGTAGTVEIEE
jgi:phosphohistidine swiveling domain-containing protein